jgi:hypothetical protein
VAIDLHEVFQRGGKPALELLDYSVRSQQMDPLFMYLTQDFRIAPSMAKAIALYEIFCAPHAPSRVSVAEVLPPQDLRLQEAVRPFRLNWTRVQATAAFDVDNRVAPLLPPRYLFDSVVRGLEQGACCTAIRESYNPELSPVQNLPGGTMTANQRYFVDKVWQPVIRPHLTAAGFWRISSVGG